MIYSCTLSERVASKTLRLWAAALTMLLLAMTAAACGDGDEGSAAPSTNVAERGFLEAMVPHHESAIAMAEVAVERTVDPEIKQLAEGIRDAQAPEIKQMGSIHQRLFGSALQPHEGGHEALGLSAEESGMGHGNPAGMLRDADPFDRAFVDEMVPHHRGAIRMARAVLKKTDDAELEKLANAIIGAQTREISEMNAFRAKRYGSPVPEKGDPAEGGHGGEMEGH